jgi:xanthine dehydrogenase YagT iron-sulfur-binding subunit
LLTRLTSVGLQNSFFAMTSLLIPFATLLKLHVHTAALHNLNTRKTMNKPASPSGSQANSSPGLSRRAMVQVSTAIAAAPLVGCASGPTSGTTASPAAGIEPTPVMMRMNLQVNGQAFPLTIDGRTSLLDALRENMNLKGSKKGCDHGQCGACTVLLDGRRVLSCLSLAASQDGATITTAEGLGTVDKLHPLQQAFIDHDGLQCGYCTPGQICSAIGMLDEFRNGEASHVTPPGSAAGVLTDDEIRERMSGNLCRCGAYVNIVAAIRKVRQVAA